MVSQVESDGAGQMVTFPDSVFSTNLVRRHPGRVRLERQIDQLEHRLKIAARFVRCQVEIQMVGVHRRQGRIDPVFRLLDLDLRLTHGIQIFVQAFLVP